MRTDADGGGGSGPGRRHRQGTSQPAPAPRPVARAGAETAAGGRRWASFRGALDPARHRPRV